MSTDPANLEFTADEMRRMGYATIERFVDYILSLETQSARGDVAAADLCRRLREPAPERGVAYEPLIDRLLTEWVPRSFTSSGPGAPQPPRVDRTEPLAPLPNRLAGDRHASLREEIWRESISVIAGRLAPHRLTLPLVAST